MIQYTIVLALGCQCLSESIRPQLSDAAGGNVGPDAEMLAAASAILPKSCSSFIAG